jgi:hypothetical protein
MAIHMNMMSQVIGVYQRLLADVSELSKVPLGSPDDISYEWVLIEGPKLDRALLLYLENGGEIPSFPEWLMPLIDKFLSTMDGTYLRYIRQCLLFCYKIEYEPTNEQLKEAQASFEETEKAVGVFEDSFNRVPRDADPLFSSARKIVSQCIDYKTDWSSIDPQHGPGAVYPRALPSRKGRFTTVYTSIEKKFSFLKYFWILPNSWFDPSVLKDGEHLVPSDTIECRLVAVPKDSRGPRLICVHPSASVWIQQGCRKVLEKMLESPRSLCHGKLNFHDQSVNGSLALSSSKDQEYVTLDLKEASDRICCSLVKFLFGTYIYDILSCSRATHVRLLDNRVIELRKWAPMGNSLTFPVQSLLFFALVRAGILCRYGVNCTDIYVFGDDIIFPKRYYDGAVCGLVRAGVIPNLSKTFRHGFFRESCGVDAYRGKDVTPHRLRKGSGVSVSDALSICSLAKAMKAEGYHRTSHSLYRIVERFHGHLHYSNNYEAQGLFRFEPCAWSNLLKYEKSIKFDHHTHRWLTQVILVQPLLEERSCDSWWNLQESLQRISRLGDCYASSRGLEYTVPHRERLQRGWTDVIMTSTSLIPTGRCVQREISTYLVTARALSQLS